MNIQAIKAKNIQLCQILETGQLAKQLAIVWAKSETSEKDILSTSKTMHNVLAKQSINKALSGLSIN